MGDAGYVSARNCWRFRRSAGAAWEDPSNNVGNSPRPSIEVGAEAQQRRAQIRLGGIPGLPRLALPPPAAASYESPPTRAAVSGTVANP
jgi:hypothetical protein